MDLQSSLLSQLGDPMLSRNDLARLRCELARELEETGNYEAARSALGELWQRIGEHPHLEQLGERIAAEVLLRAGALTGWIGSAQQTEGAQETAKDLIGESLAIFESLHEKEKTAEALTELSVCYWREGAYDEARVALTEALARLAETDGKQKAVTLLRSAIVEFSAMRYDNALRILTNAAPLFLTSSSHALRGKFHVNLAIVLNNLGEGKQREGFCDRALVEYEAASFHFEQAGHAYYQARTENNLAVLLLRNCRFDEAHEHLDRARRLFEGLKDNNSIAHVDDTRARTLLAQGHAGEAEGFARAAVRRLEKGDERSILAGALITQGTALARLGRTDEAHSTLQYATEVAHQVGAPDDAGLASLTIIEELGESLATGELRAIYERADHLLANSQQPGILLRLRQAMRRILAAERTHSRSQEATGFSAPPNFVYRSAQMAELLSAARHVARARGPVLMTGEAGTGKGMLARMIHEWSELQGELVAVNCAALDEPLMEAQLFGDFKGGLTGAASEYPGAVRRAMGGTLFLDEISELSMSNQGQLLRLVEHGKVHSAGALQPERADVRIIAATTRPLREEVAQGRFRSDLFYRLQSFELKIPPLRERTEDIPVLAEQIIREVMDQYGLAVTFAPGAIEAMRQLPLQGNARELRSLIERSMLMAPVGSEIAQDAVTTFALRTVSEASFADAWKGCSLEQEVQRYEADLIKRALEASKGSVTRAARLLGLSHQGLAFILQGRQKDLLSARTPARRRRRSLSGASKRKRR
jgi:DNA-binding NtrC family response regulator/tetratricopeptide (TPR) repeat protein